MTDARANAVHAGPAGYNPVRLSDGTTLFVAVRGTGPALLLVHGWAAHGGFFDSLADALESRFTLVIPDLRGHGRTPSGEAPLTIDQLADDLNEMLSLLDLQNVLALGWSMGAMVLWTLIARHGASRLAGLITEDMSPRILNDEAWTLGMLTGLDQAASTQIETAMRQNWPAYAAAFAPRMFARPLNGTQPDALEWAARDLANNSGAAMADFWESMAAKDCRDGLAAIPVPALVTYGERSQVYGPQTSQFIANTIPDARALGFARSGHAPHIEETEAFARAVSTFAETAFAAAQQSQFHEGSSTP